MIEEGPPRRLGPDLWQYFAVLTDDHRLIRQLLLDLQKAQAQFGPQPSEYAVDSRRAESFDERLMEPKIGIANIAPIDTLGQIAQPGESPARKGERRRIAGNRPGRLEFQQCPNCPLKPEASPRCPVAVSLVDLMDLFKDSLSIETAEVVIISETAAHAYLAGEDPLGRRLLFGGTWHTIIGVASDVKDSAIEKPADPHNYTPYLAMSDGALADPTIDGLRTLHLAVRARSDPSSVLSQVRREIASLDPQLAVADAETMDAEIQESLAPQRFNLFLIGLFAILAVFLASVGVYGVLSQSVAQRTHEFGVRIVLGARAQDVVRITVREGMKLAFLGAAIGSLGAFSLTHMMASLLYGVSAHDPITFIGVVITMCGVAFLACYVPARRAMRVDPMVALRYE